MCLLFFLPIYSQANEDNISLDRKLIKSLEEKNLKAAEIFLTRGANPEAIFGISLGDNAVCTAIDGRSSVFLELLVKYGASTNAHWDIDYDLHRTPLACSVYLLNFEAFEYLLENGADPSVDLYDQSNNNRKHAKTALTIALGTSNFRMALTLVKHYTLHPAELRRLVYALERYPFSEDHPWNDARNELIAWTKERVPTLTPKPASPSDGRPRKCLFHFRDIEEGLKKGTVCWDTEDN